MSDDLDARLKALEDKKTVVGDLMKNGGGAAIGAGLGYAVGVPVAAALAPFTFGLSAVIPFGIAVATGVYGHKKAKDLD